MSHRIAVIAVLGCAITLVASYAGLLVSYHVSVTYGVRLAAGPTVVLALAGLYLILATVTQMLRWRPRRREVQEPAPVRTPRGRAGWGVVSWLDSYLHRAIVEVVLVGALAGIVGVHIVLRRLAFFTMAMTHATFPGVVIAAIVGFNLYLGGAMAGLFVAAAVLAASRRRGQDTSTATGVVLATGFALGVALMSTQPGFTRNLSAYLVGSVLTVDTSDLLTAALVAGGVATVLFGLRKELLYLAFDPNGARAAGYPVAVLDFTLLVAIEAAVVTTVPAVGTILCVALLVAPAAAARLWTDRVAPMHAIAVGIGIGSGLGRARGLARVRRRGRRRHHARGHRRVPGVLVGRTPPRPGVQNPPDVPARCARSGPTLAIVSKEGCEDCVPRHGAEAAKNCSAVVLISAASAIQDQRPREAGERGRRRHRANDVPADPRRLEAFTHGREIGDPVGGSGGVERVVERNIDGERDDQLHHVQHQGGHDPGQRASCVRAKMEDGGEGGQHQRAGEDDGEPTVQDRHVDRLHPADEGPVVRAAKTGHDRVRVRVEQAGHEPHGYGGRDQRGCSKQLEHRILRSVIDSKTPVASVSRVDETGHG